MYENNVEIVFDAKSENESFARVAAAAFVTKLARQHLLSYENDIDQWRKL